MATRNRVGVNDDLNTVITKLHGQKLAKLRWGYKSDALTLNLTLHLLSIAREIQVNTVQYTFDQLLTLSQEAIDENNPHQTFQPILLTLDPNIMPLRSEDTIEISGVRTTGTGNVPAISEASFTGASVAYSAVAVTETVTNETLNRGSGSVAVATNVALEKITAYLNGLTASLSAGINERFSQVTSNVNTAITEMGNAVNMNLQSLREQINRNTGISNENIGFLQSQINSLQNQINSLNSTYSTDSDMASVVANVNSLFEGLRAADVSFLNQWTVVMASLNEMEMTFRAQVTVDSASGRAYYSLVDSKIGGYPSGEAYEVFATPESSVNVSIENQTGDGFDIVLKDLTTYSPIPYDAVAKGKVNVNLLVTGGRRTSLANVVDLHNGLIADVTPVQ